MTSGQPVQMDTSWEVFIGQETTLGCTTSKRLDVVSQKACQIDMRTAILNFFWGSFDGKGLSECRREGYYMAGIFRGDCDKLYCLEELKCCRMIGN